MGALAPVPATDLGAIAIREALFVEAARASGVSTLALHARFK